MVNTKIKLEGLKIAIHSLHGDPSGYTAIVPAIPPVQPARTLITALRLNRYTPRHGWIVRALPACRLKSLAGLT